MSRGTNSSLYHWRRMNVLLLVAAFAAQGVQFCQANQRKLRFFGSDWENLDEESLKELLDKLPSPPTPQPDTCWFCDEENFTGGFGCLERGVGDYPDLTGPNGHNDRYESIICGEDVHAIVYAAVDFRASMATIVGSERSLRASGWSNRISSLKVRRNPDNRIIVLEDQGSYRGRPYIKRVTFMPDGTYDLGPLQERGLLLNGRQITEIIIPEARLWPWVVLASHPSSFTIQGLSNHFGCISSCITQGRIEGARLQLRSGHHYLRELSFQRDGETVTWAEGLQGMVVRNRN